MITQNIFKFLTSLQKNNNRGWFQKNKELYDTAKKEFEIFTNLLINEVKNIDPDIGSLTAKDCIFRIFRDVRFSKDKSPYKTNFGAYVVKGGKKSGNAGYYIHIEPGNSFLAGGIHMPASPILNAVRKEIYDNTEEFKSIINAPNFKKYYKELLGNKLKMAPKGFPKDFKDIELLKFKDYTVVNYYPDDFMQSDKLMKEIKDAFTAMLPFNQFINRAIEEI